MITANKITVQFGKKPLFEDISIHLAKVMSMALLEPMVLASLPL